MADYIDKVNFYNEGGGLQKSVPIKDSDTASKVANLTTKVNTNTTNINTLNNKATQAASDISALENKVSVLNNKATQAASDISALENQVSVLNNNTFKKILLLGDSYLAGFGLSAPSTQNYGYLLKQMLAGSGKTVDYKGVNGAGFSTTLENNFYSILQTYASTLSSYDLVIFCGGFNDAQNSGQNWASITSGINQCASYIKSHGNAAIYVMFVGLGSSFGYSANAANAFSAYASNVNVCFVSGSPCVLHDYRSDYLADTIHPSVVGQQKLAKAVYSAIFSGSCYNGGFALLNSGTYNLLETMDGDTVRVSVLGSYNRTWKGQTGTTLLDFGAIPAGFFKAGAESTFYEFSCILQCDTSMGVMWMPGNCSFGKVGDAIHFVVSPCITNPNQGALDVTKTTLLGASFTVPAVIC